MADGFTNLATRESDVNIRPIENEGRADAEGKVSVNVIGQRSDLCTAEFLRYVQACLVAKADRNQSVFEVACFKEIPTHPVLEF